MTTAAEVIPALRPAPHPHTFAQDLEVLGDIHDGVEATIAGFLRVSGTIGAARLSIGNSLDLVTGIAGRDLATVHAARDVRATYLHQADLRIGGDLQIDAEIAGCTITVGGLVRAPTAAIHGGRLIAAKPVDCATLGSPAGTPTLVRLGTIPDLHRVIDKAQTLLPELDDRLAAMRVELTKLRLAKDGTARRAERITELEYELPSLQARRGPLLKSVTSTLTLLRRHTRGRLTVHTLAHRNTRIELDGWLIEVTADTPGPFRLELPPPNPHEPPSRSEPRIVNPATGAPRDTPRTLRIASDPAYDARRAFLERYSLDAIVHATIAGAA